MDNDDDDAIDAPSLPTYAVGGGKEEWVEHVSNVEEITEEARAYLESVGIAVPPEATLPMAERCGNDSLYKPSHSNTKALVMTGVAHQVPWVLIVAANRKAEEQAIREVDSKKCKCFCFVSQIVARLSMKHSMGHCHNSSINGERTRKSRV
jgi:hypothetical protein